MYGAFYTPHFWIFSILDVVVVPDLALEHKNKLGLKLVKNI